MFDLSFFIVSFFLTLSSAKSKAVKLTSKNYDELTRGKRVLIRFLVPNGGEDCSYCDVIEPLWEKLADEWDDDPVGLIADVDCTLFEEDFINDLCEKNDIRSLLVFKHGDPAALETISFFDADEIQFETLSTFAKDHLRPACTAETLSLCSGSQRTQIDKFKSMSIAQLDAAIGEIDSKLARVQYVEDEIDEVKESCKEINYLLEQEAHIKYENVAWLIEVLRFMKDPSPTKKKTFPLEPRRGEKTKPSVSSCSPLTLSKCNDKEKQLIAKYKTLDMKSIDESIESKFSKLGAIQDEFDSNYEITMGTASKITRDLKEEAEIILHDAKLSGYYFMRSLRGTKLRERSNA